MPLPSGIAQQVICKVAIEFWCWSRGYEHDDHYLRLFKRNSLIAEMITPQTYMCVYIYTHINGFLFFVYSELAQARPELFCLYMCTWVWCCRLKTRTSHALALSLGSSNFTVFHIDKMGGAWGHDYYSHVFEQLLNIPFVACYRYS